MLEKLKGLSTKAKIGLAGGAAVLAAAGVGLGITQPWKQPEQTPDAPAVQQQEPQEVQKQPETGLSVRAGNEEVPCTLYEGDGWTIYLPEGWTAETLGDKGALFSSGDGAQLSVRLEPGGGYGGSFVNLSASGTDRLLQFYEKGGPVIVGNAPEANWGRYGKLFTALARTLETGGGKPFEDAYIIPQEPDWQRTEGVTVLFLDKDGFVLEDKIREAVESYMRSWPAETRTDYTGKYRINDIQWASSFTGVTRDGYIDVFRADVQYQLNEGASPKGVTAVNGWASGDEDVYLVISHDGGTVGETRWVVSDLADGWAGFAGECGFSG